MKKQACKYRFFFQIACLLLSGMLQAQSPADTLSRLRGDTLSRSALDSLPPTAVDSAIVDFSKVKISNDGVDDIVEYGAQDSMWFDVKNKRLHLYGQATVKYTTLNITAGYILLDYVKNEVSAESFPDSSGTAADFPKFKSADQEFEANRLRFNFKTKKGIIYEARTKQEDLYILGERSKFVGSPDTTKRNTIYNSNSILTTCDDPHPHYGIRAKKLKVIPDRMVITGPANLEIGGVPTPLFLPFGFFPISKTRRAGLIIPQDFEFARVEGLGIKNFGWYQPINEHMDAKFLLNAYTNGSWGTEELLRYDNKYHYTGNFDLTYNNRVSEDAFANRIKNKSFGLIWSHQQDPKANPTKRFGGSMHIETNRDQNRNRNDYQSVYQNSLSSNLNYSQTFPGKPFSLTAGLSHSQNTQTRIMTISFPNINFTMQRIYPFKRKTSDGTERWFEKLSLTYNSSLQNSVRVPDTLLFTRATLQNAQLGIQHRASTDYTFKLFKYINIAPQVSYEENWYPYTIEHKLLDKNKLVYDTTIQELRDTFVVLNEAASQFGQDTTIRHYGFKTFRNYNAGISANTTLFFTRQFKNGWFRGFRHKITPSVSLGFGPDFTQTRYQRYFGTYVTDSRPSYADTVPYSIYDNGIFGKPTNTPRQVAIGYSLGNVLEFKHRVRRDSTGEARPNKKVTLFNNLTFSGNYSLTADTLKWSIVSTGGSFRLFKGVTNVNWNAAFDPYITDAKGKRINVFAIKQQGRLVRLTSFNFQFSTGFTVTQVRKAFEKKNAAATSNIATHDDLLGWFDNFRVSHNISFARSLRATGYGTTRDTLIVSGNNISLNGSIPLTSKWSIDLNNISYDLVSKKIVYPDLGISRDLHCWQMSISWQPTRGTYFFTINVKPGSLEFLKLPYQKNYYDARQ